MHGPRTPDRWGELKAIVQAALDVPPDERPAYLTRACGADTELRREAESLLAAAVTDSFLHAPAVAGIVGESQPANGPEIVERLSAALEGRYVIERELGRGGMATVYLARDSKHRRQVALQVLDPALGMAVGPSRFHREIETAAGLSHPHILALHDSGEADGLLYYVMPYVAGESLRQRLRRGPLPVPEALRVIREVADALDHSHRRGVVHRDVKPENVLLDETGHALVADFGIARAVDLRGATEADADASAGRLATLTTVGAVIGTPAYMSPEQAFGDRAVDGRADVYALGCVAFEMLVGERLFANTSGDFSLRRFTAPPPSIAAHNPDMAGADAVIARALAFAPEERYPTATAFADALAATLLPASNVAPSAVVPADRRTLFRALGVYAAAFVTVAALAWVALDSIGLPDWTFSGALVVMALGLPPILVTWLAHSRAPEEADRSDAAEGRLARLARRVRPYASWRRVAAGGLVAVGLFAVAVTGFMLLRRLGIGPPGTLLAAGVLQEHDRVLVADFANRTRDSLLAAGVTDAFRVDLAKSEAVRLVPAAHVADVLGRMRRDQATPLTAELAREIAAREGIKAIVVGEIASVGPRFLLSAQLVSVTGEVLAAERETADDSADLVSAVDRLSKRVRAKIGESLKSLRSEPPLEQVTTGSLPALRKYTQAIRAGDFAGDYPNAIELLEEAVRLDSGFATAYRTLGVYYSNVGNQKGATEALTKAFNYRDRLTDQERDHTRALYYQLATKELDKAVAVYESVLERYPRDSLALNNLANLYGDMGQLTKAENTYRRVLAVVDSFAFPANMNLAITLAQLGKIGEAERALDRAERTSPDSPRLWNLRIGLAVSEGNYRKAEASARVFKERHAPSVQGQLTAIRLLSWLAAVHGRLAEAERLDRNFVTMARGGKPPDAAAQLAAALRSVTFVDMGPRRDPRRALTGMESALARYPLAAIPPTERPYLDLVAVYAFAGKPRVARAHLQEYQRTRSPEQQREDESNVRWAAVHLAFAETRFDDAIGEARAWVELETAAAPNTTWGLPELALAYDHAGRPDSAIAVYERFVSLRQDLDRLANDAQELARAHERLGNLYETRGDRVKAVQHYKRFVELWQDCDPELRPVVAEARRRLVRLTGESRAAPSSTAPSRR
jgi:eukaryotic-like serine/threonine-protein kinase